MSDVPHSIRVWDNSARLGLPPLLKAWLLLLVVAFLTAIFFVFAHLPARWVLGGFIVSHVIVYMLSVAKNYVLRAGMVSMLHVICWSPGLVVSLLDWDERAVGGPYQAWSYFIIAVIVIAFVFDIRDATRYVYYYTHGLIPQGSESDDGNSVATEIETEME